MMKQIASGLLIFLLFVFIGAVILPIAIDKEIERQNAVTHSYFEQGYIE